MSKSEETKKRPILSVAQMVVIIGIIIAVAMAMNLNAKAHAGRTLSKHETALSLRVTEEVVRQGQLVITLTYVYSNDYVADYARNQGGMILPGEKRVAPLLHPPPPTPTPIPTSISDLMAPNTPFEAWWVLFFDSPPPGR